MAIDGDCQVEGDRNYLKKDCQSSSKEELTELHFELSENFQFVQFDKPLKTPKADLNIGEPVYIDQRSVDPPSFMQLLGSVNDWLPLKAAAAYLIRFAVRAADETLDRTTSLRKSKKDKQFLIFIEALTEIASEIDSEVEIIIGLNIPDDLLGTAISIKESSLAHDSQLIAKLIANVDKISNTVNAEIQRDAYLLDELT